MRKLIIPTILLATTLIASQALAGPWKIDKGHSKVYFKVTHMMVTTVRGDLGGADGTVSFNPADPTKSSINVTIDVSTITTNDAKRDGHLKSKDFFDVANHPKATFKSKKISKSGSKYKIVGDLTIRGVTKSVTLDAEISKPVKAPWGAMVVGIHATTEINRKDFGVNWNKTLDKGGLLVSNEVLLSIELQLHNDSGKSS